MLQREKFATQIARVLATVDQLVLDYALLARTVKPATIDPVVINDPDDDQVLACAVAAHADLVVSGTTICLISKTTKGYASSRLRKHCEPSRASNSNGMGIVLSDCYNGDILGVESLKQNRAAAKLPEDDVALPF